MRRSGQRRILRLWSPRRSNLAQAELFSYDQSSSLEAICTLVEENALRRVCELSYRNSADLERVDARLIVPSGAGPFSFVMLLHGGGQNCDAFLAEGNLLAEVGIASLLVDLPQARKFPDFSDPEADQNTLVETVIGVRRGLDYLASQPDIDIGRGAVVGFSFGAW